MACSMQRQSHTGCEHYKRKVKIVSPCCQKIYDCRICHDDKEDHELIRRNIKEVVCSYCDKRQKVHEYCKFCGIVFGQYFCPICNLFDDEPKGQFHCKECGICRVGFMDNYFHCQTCNLCLSIQLLGNHKCLENASRINCPICVEDIHSSREPCFVPKCMHMLHNKCKDQLISSGRNNCPLCDTKFDLPLV